jgi:hypothetical protein
VLLAGALIALLVPGRRAATDEIEASQGLKVVVEAA